MISETLSGAIAVRDKISAILGAHGVPSLEATEFQGNPSGTFTPVPGTEYFSPSDFARCVELGWLAPVVVSTKPSPTPLAYPAPSVS